MEKAKEEKKLETQQPQKSKNVVWDCESSLYDSFELKSFERQLDSAIITSRTLSMPHLSDHRHNHHHDDQKTPVSKKHSYSKLSRSLHRFLRSVFRPKHSNSNSNSNNNNNNNNNNKSSWFRVEKGSREGVYYVYDTSGSLTTIPEVPEISCVGDDHFDGLSPEMKSFVRRTASDRFAPASLGISCA